MTAEDARRAAGGTTPPPRDQAPGGLPAHRRSWGHEHREGDRTAACCWEGPDVAAALRAEGAADDVWTFYGDKGIRSLDAHVRHHGVPVAIVRVAQRLLTNDCEYCDGLSAALGRGAMALAARVPGDGVEELSERLRRQGGHTLAYGEHWNFVPVGDAGHAIGQG
ncbi:MAG: hypothetical protein ACRDZR_15545 [Acidimicrobiales bacterium]